MDAVPPDVQGIEITSDAGSDATYGLGDDIEVTVSFSEIVHVLPAPDDPVLPLLQIAVGRLVRNAVLVDGSGTETLRFRYTVQLGDDDDDGISIGPDPVIGGVIRDDGGTAMDRTFLGVPAQPAHKVDAGDAEPPGVTEVAIVSAPQAGDTYGTGEAIRVRVTFDREVHVTGDPVLRLSIGGATRDAAFVSGSGTRNG